MIFNINPQIIVDKTFDELQKRSVITQNSRGSSARALVEAIGSQFAISQDEAINVLRDSFIAFSTGDKLDLIGEILGITRLGQTKSFSSIDDKNIKFYVDSGTFGDINNSSTIFIPANSVRFVPSITGISTTQLSFFNPNNIILDPNDSETYIDIESVQFGPQTELGARTLTRHTFTNYSNYTVNNKLLKVINESTIVGGRSQESDNNFRFRIKNANRAAEAANDIAITLGLLLIPGISDVKHVPYSNGIGTGTFLIKTVIPSTPSSIITLAQETINHIKGTGNKIIAAAPTLLGLEFFITLSYKYGTQLSVIERAEINAANAIGSYINNLDINQDFFINKLVSVILTSDSNIINVGTSTQPIDRIFLYRTSIINSDRIRRKIFTDVTVDIDERVILETSIDNPIHFTRKFI